MDEERISRLLASLPRETASPQFTAGVLERLADAPRRRRQQRWIAAACAAVVLLAGTFGLRWWSEERARERQRQEALVRLEALEAEKRALEDEISRLRRMARDARPVVYLGSTPNLDMVLDLGRLARRRSQAAGGIRPANHDITTRPQGEHR